MRSRPVIRQLVVVLFALLLLQACNGSRSSSSDLRSPADGSTVAGDATRPGTGSRRDGPAALDGPAPPPTAGSPRIFVPLIKPDDPQAAIADNRQLAALLWFGPVDSKNNHTQVKLGYNASELHVHAMVFDQKIYDEAADDALEKWDSITLLLDLEGGTPKQAVDGKSYRIDAQAHRHGSERTVFYRGQAGSWVKTQLAAVVEKSYRGEGRDESRGWTITFRLPWAALGLAGPPAPPQNLLRAALLSYDRDNLAGTVGGTPQRWPGSGLDPLRPAGWGLWEIWPGHFKTWSESGSAPGKGKPAYAIGYTPAAFRPGSETTITIRQGLPGIQVENACVGASERLCSGDDNYNFGDGPNSWGGNTARSFFHVQNQEDVADWPCFARLYVKFPLASVPPGKVLVSARLRLHHKDPTSSGSEGARTLLQVFPVANELEGTSTSWTAKNLTWNNAPVPRENVAGTWGDRTGFAETGWDSLPAWEWDVSRALARALGQTHVSFALYSSDSEYHTGKQFIHSADFPDWGRPEQRPTLTVVVADPP